MAEIVTGVTTAVGTMVGDLLSGAGSIVTAAFPAVAALIGVGFLIKAVKKVVGR